MKKIFKWIGIGVVILLALLVVVPYFFYPAAYVSRVFRWMDADVYDYQKFPERLMEPGEETFYFDEKLDEAHVSQTFEEAGDFEDLETFLTETNTQAFIVIQADTILYEKYFNSAQRDTIVTSFSMAKSFASTLIGMAIEDGSIGSAIDPITDYLPELLDKDPRFAEITIEDLISMSSGISYKELPYVTGDDAKTYYYPDLRTLALNETEIVAQPGEFFLYNNYHPLLIGMILERATGMPVADYLETKIWQPLGMEYSGSWSLDSDETGFEKMESGINGRAIDFAKFGRLFLNGGSWEGEQIVPEAWVIAATAPTAQLGDDIYYAHNFLLDSSLGQGYYGYFWWGMTRGADQYDFSALGNHGQFIYISPENDLIIVRHGEGYGVDALTWWELFYNFAEEINR